MEKLKAWSVHAYTASGGVFAFLSLVAFDREDWRAGMAWLLVCLFIDGSDGLLARRWEVSRVLPHIQGKNIDFVIDFLTYAFLPAYFIYKAELVDPSVRLWASFYVILISAFYYGQARMVTDKDQFAGFPVLWNLVVFYAFFVFRQGPTFNLGMILLFGVLHFAPIEVSYPSRNIKKSVWPAAIGFSMIGVLLAILYLYPEQHWALTTVALLAFVYFIYLTVRYTWWK